MKHAYLILAHHEFEVLNHLIAALDDARNDIYIHFDQKVKKLPNLYIKHAGLILLDNRVDVRWGDVSVVEAEFRLFECAKQQSSGYSYYHLISGVDMPLRDQNELHAFFQKNQGKQFIGYSQGDQLAHIERKVNRYHLFPRHFRSNRTVSAFVMKTLRFLWLRAQVLLGIKRNQKIVFKKGTQWVSLSDSFVAYLLTQKQEIFEVYQNTFCADEIVVQTACWNSSFRDTIYDTDDEANGSQRAIQWVGNQIYDWELKDLPQLLQSDLLFARKFNSRHQDVLSALSAHVSLSRSKKNDL